MPLTDLPTRLAMKWLDKFEKNKSLSIDAIVEGAVREALEEADKTLDQIEGWAHEIKGHLHVSNLSLADTKADRIRAAIAALRS